MALTYTPVSGDALKGVRQRVTSILNGVSVVGFSAVVTIAPAPAKFPTTADLALAQQRTGINYTTKGPRTATTKKAGVDTLPTGSYIDNGNTIRFNASATVNFAGWDLSNYAVYAENGANITFTDCRFLPHSVASGCAIQVVGATTVNASFCDFDGGSLALGVSSLIFINTAAGNVSITDSRLHGSACDFVTVNGNTTISRNLIYDGGYNTTGLHFDGMQLDTLTNSVKTTLVVTDNFIDGSIVNAVEINNLLRFDAENGVSVTGVTVTGNVGISPSTVQQPFALGRRVDSSPGTLAKDYTVRNNWLRYATAGSLYPYETPTGLALWQNNRRFDNATLIALPSGWTDTDLAGGTSAARYSVAGSRMRWPTVARAVPAGYNYFASETWLSSDDYAQTEWRFFMPTFIGTSGLQFAETPVGNTITIEAASLTVAGVQYPVPAGNFPIVVDPSVSGGVLLPAIPGVTVPPNTMVKFTIAYMVPTGGSVPVSGRAGVGIAANTAYIERNGGSTASLASRTTDGVALSQTNSHTDCWQPAFAIAKGGDGRPATIIVGDSIGFGANESSYPALWSARGDYGYIQRGLADNATTKRLAYTTCCIPGQGPGPNSSFPSAGWKFRANWSRKLDAYKTIFTETGQWPFDLVLGQHGNNSLGGNDSASFVQLMKDFYSLINSEWGKPIVAVELISRAASTDNWRTLANQTPNVSIDAWPSGARWVYNEKISQDGGDPTPTSEFRAGNFITDSIPTWKGSAYDLGANRDKVKVLPFVTTLASAAVQNQVNGFSLVDAPPIHSYINIGGVADGFVTAVSGPGPYSVNCSMTAQVPAGGVPTGAIVNNKLRANDQTHPGKEEILLLAQPVIAWKLTRGYSL